jgi:hypothetical protein
MCRPYTQEEAQKEFLDHIKMLVNYWSKIDETKKECLSGLAFSILSMLDGCTNLPAYEVIPIPHPDDKQYKIENEENYYEPVDLPENIITIHGGHMLHEIFYK